MTDSIPINIPADEEGFIALQCPHCRASFKVLALDLNNFEGTELCCAVCGLAHERAQFLMTPDVCEIIEAEAHNLVADMLNEFSRGLERSSRESTFVKIQTSKVRKRAVPELRAITDLAEVEIFCCETVIKVDFAQAATLFYCPLCGQVQT